MCRSTNQRSARLVARIGPERPWRAQNHARWLQIPVAGKATRGPANSAEGPSRAGGRRLHKVPLGMGPAAHYLAADSMEDPPRLAAGPGPWMGRLSSAG